jgi:hypothetical protein
MIIKYKGLPYDYIGIAGIGTVSFQPGAQPIGTSATIQKGSTVFGDRTSTPERELAFRASKTSFPPGKLPGGTVNSRRSAPLRSICTADKLSLCVMIRTVFSE